MLRDKKTGKLGYLLTTKDLNEYIIIDGEYKTLARYDSLAKLNKDWEDYKEDEPDAGYLVATVQKLENRVKTLNGRIKEQAEKMDTLRDGINELHKRLKTVEENHGAPASRR